MVQWYDNYMNWVISAAAGLLIIIYFRQISNFLLRPVRYWNDVKGTRELVFLQVTMPKKEGKEDKEISSEQFSSTADFKEVLGIMDHLFQAIHYYREYRIRRYWQGQPFFSVELAALRGEILFFFVVHRSIAEIIEKQITSFYPDAVIDQVEDYSIFTENSVVDAHTFLVRKKTNHGMFRTYKQLNSDPLNNTINVFSKLKPHEGAALQFVLCPATNDWQKKLQKVAQKVLNKSAKSKFKWWNPITWFTATFEIIYSGESSEMIKVDKESQERVTQMVEEYSKSLDEKANNPGYGAQIRIIASSDNHRNAHAIIDSIRTAFGQFSEFRGNNFYLPKIYSVTQIVKCFIQRWPRPSSWYYRFFTPQYIFGTSELTSFFHFPNIKYNKLDMIKWQNYKLAPAPKNIPEEGLFLGTNIFRGDKRKIFMNNEDRFRHFYIVGQTGTGKSSVIQLMARQDFHQGKGICVIDPHGSLIEDLLPYIPRERADDVIYFNPVDTERPMGLNLLEGKTQEEKELIALDAMNMMVKMFGEEIFGPRIQDYFRNGCLTLMEDDEEGGAITDLVKLFTDEEWQKYKVTKVKNPIVKAFWEKQMAQTGQREKQEMIPYFAAKFGQFYTNSLIRNIVGQTKSSFDVSQAMNERKIILANLSKGLIGDVNSQLLGMIFVNKVQVAAMRRQLQSKEERQDFFLYIDEFQNFVTQSIESILSEARKYRLGLILAHQYLDQLEKESKLSGNVSLKGAVFGNVGTMMMYKIGPQDAETCAKEMAPVFSEQDLINLEAFKGAMKLSVDSQPSRPFSISVPRPWLDNTYIKDEQAAEAFKQLSRLTYGRQKDFVDKEILRRIG